MNLVITLALALRQSALQEVLHNSCNLGTCDLPDMYALTPRTAGICIRQITCARVTAVHYHASTYVFVHKHNKLRIL